MREKEIVKGKLLNSDKFKKIFGIICGIVFIGILIYAFSDIIEWKNSACDWCAEYERSYTCNVCEKSVISMFLAYGYIIYALIPVAVYGLVLLFVKFFWNVIELNVTDKRVYGKTVFGKRVDLPLDSISSISKMKLFNGISIATSSGRISFNFIANSEEVYSVISNLLVSRQNNKKNDKNDDISGGADEIKKYKELLDSGAITQEEYDKKKNQLLGL